MSETIALIRRKLEHLERMRGFLEFSATKLGRLLPRLEAGLGALPQEDHETLAAFRIRFSEFQEHLGKAMRAVAIEEEIDVDRFGSVLAYMERLGILDATDRWKEIRELRNSINHEYEEDATKIHRFFQALAAAVPEVLDWHDRLKAFCAREYPLH